MDKRKSFSPYYRQRKTSDVTSLDGAHSDFSDEDDADFHMNEISNNACVSPDSQTDTDMHNGGGKMKTERRFNRQTKSSKSNVPEDIRLRTNSRERDRMHSISSELDALRQVMPYSHGPSVKKLSKMSTLLLARNYIVTLTKSLEESRKMVQELTLNRAVVHHPMLGIPADFRPHIPVSLEHKTFPFPDMKHPLPFPVDFKHQLPIPHPFGLPTIHHPLASPRITCACVQCTATLSGPSVNWKHC